MLEDDYYRCALTINIPLSILRLFPFDLFFFSRQLQKKLRAAELLKSASLPPSMARRERVKSAGMQTKCFTNEKQHYHVTETLDLCSATPMTSERSRSAMTELSTRGNNLAAILRCQASR